MNLKLINEFIHLEGAKAKEKKVHIIGKVTKLRKFDKVTKFCKYFMKLD